MSATASCNDPEKQDTCQVEAEGVDNLSPTPNADDTTIEKTKAPVEEFTILLIREWAHGLMERYLSLPAILLLSLIPAGIVGTIIGVNEQNLQTDPVTHPYARFWAKTWENQAALTGLTYFIASGVAFWWRMKAEGRRTCNGRDGRILVQDLLFALVVNICLLTREDICGLVYVRKWKEHDRDFPGRVPCAV